MLKAIQTRYAGFLFRSRLEARWAVFFDALGLKWEYEPEGFELPSGRYLPDFLIRHGATELWLEVKPACDPKMSDCRKLVDFAWALPQASGLIVLKGEPYLGAGVCFVAPGGAFVPTPINPLTYGTFGSPAACAKAALDARSARFEFGESGAAA